MKWNHSQPVTDKCPPCVTMFLSSPLRFVIISGWGGGCLFLGWWCRWQPLLPPSAVLHLTLTLSASGAEIHLLMGPSSLTVSHLDIRQHPGVPGLEVQSWGYEKFSPRCHPLAVLHSVTRHPFLSFVIVFVKMGNSSGVEGFLPLFRFLFRTQSGRGYCVSSLYNP